MWDCGIFWRTTVHLSFGHSVEYSQVTLAGHPATLLTALRLTPNGMQSQRKQRENSEKTTRTAQGNREVRHNNNWNHRRTRKSKRAHRFVLHDAGDQVMRLLAATSAAPRC